MKISRKRAALLLLGVGTLVAGSAAARAQDGCVRVLGYEWSGEKQSMDPASMHSGDDAYHIFAVYNRLVDVDENFKVVPELAESWSVSEDGKTWTFKLRDGVKFQSGKPFGAADVVYTFKRILDPATGSGGSAPLGFLKDATIEAKDPLTVVFSTPQPVAELPLMITNKFTNIVPEGATTESLRLKGDGTGPFMQEEFTPNAPVRLLKANPNYWKAGKPAAPCLRITVAQEAVAATSALMAGEVDLALNVDPTAIAALKANPSVQLMETGASNSMTVSVWTDTKPFDDNRVRQAMKLAVDRQALVDSVLLGYGEVGNDNPVPLSSSNAYTTTAPARDVAKAKQLLAEAGYPNGLNIELYTAEGVPGMLKMGQSFAQMMADAGITVNVVETPADTFWDSVWLKHPMVTSAWSMRPPTDGLSYPYVQTSNVNETHWMRPEYDALLAKAAVTVDDQARTDLYKQAQKMLAEEGGVIIPMFIHQVLALREGCSGYTPHVQNFNLNFEDLHCS
ncbi:MAG: ABC transporter substrate-binding protein [Geminicoccaceae bacterium]